jgi:hypothetical protein
VKHCSRKLLFLTLLAARLVAHDIITTNLTYTRDISRIFVRRCVSCHGASASLPLSSYSEVRPWAVAIKEQVLSRAMPPWSAVKGFGELSPDGALTQEEIMIVAGWVIGGAPQGDPALLSGQVAASVHMPAPAVKDGATIKGRGALDKSLDVVGIRPLPGETADSARITARLPDGRIEPLVWLYRFGPQSNQTFFFRKPLILPAGTVVESSQALRFALEVGTPTSTKTSQAR